MQCSRLTASLVPAEFPLLRVFTSTFQPGASSPPVPPTLLKPVQPPTLHEDDICQVNVQHWLSLCFAGTCNLCHQGGQAKFPVHANCIQKAEIWCCRYMQSVHQEMTLSDDMHSVMQLVAVSGKTGQLTLLLDILSETLQQYFTLWVRSIAPQT